MNSERVSSRTEAHKKPGTEAGIPGPGSSLEGRDSDPNTSDWEGLWAGSPLWLGRKGQVEPGTQTRKDFNTRSGAFWQGRKGQGEEF